MKRIRIWISAILCCVMLGSGFSAYALDITARGGFVLNSNTGQEVYGYAADTPMVPASMTKVMAAYVIYEALSQGRITKDTMIPVGDALAAYSRDPGYSNVTLRAGESYRVDELLSALFVVSANAAVMAMGDYLYGSEPGFVSRMNQIVNGWQIDAYFEDCTGVSGQNRVTPRAMATIANRLVCDYPDCLGYSSMTSLNFRGQNYYPTNKMLPGKPYAYSGIVGLKTGTTSAAGACFTGVAERDGTRMISVVMGAPYSDARFIDSIAMLDYAFSRPESKPQAAPALMADGSVFYVNDLPIAGFIRDGTYFIRVEDLRSYGFDVNYDAQTNTLEVMNRKETPLPDDMVVTAADAAFTPSKAVNILLKQNAEDYGIFTLTAYDIAGKAAMDIKELSYLGWVLTKEKTAVAVTR